MNKMLLVDGFSLLFRAYYASVNTKLYDENQLKPSGAIRIFFTQIYKFIKELEPTHVGVVFDYDGKSYRTDVFSEYKGTRKEAPEDLQKQIQPTKNLLKYFGITCLDAHGFEADDYIGTFASNFKGDTKVYIMSGDKDLWQLLDENVEIIYPGFKDFGYINPKVFREKFDGLEPIQLIELKSIMGDSSDNYPGIKGIGEKGALSLVKEFGSFENIIKNIENIPSKATQAKLREGEAIGRTCHFLATIKNDIEHNYKLEDFLPGNKDMTSIFMFIDEYKLHRLKDLIDVWK